MNIRVLRRTFLAGGLVVPSFAARKRAAPLLDRGFARVYELAGGVYATIADPAKGPQCASNGGVIAGRDAVLIIEGHMQPAGAAMEIEVAREVSKAPIRGAVDTHFHFDHTFGNPGYAERRIPILAHESVIPFMKRQYEALKGADKASLLAPFEKRVEAAATETVRKRRLEDLAKYKSVYAAIDSATFAYPTESLGSGQLPMRIDLGGLTAIIEYLPGHSGTDLIVRIPERGVVFAGDLLFNAAYPVSVDADMIAWRRALDRLLRLGRNTQYVPGHSSVCGAEVVKEQCALFDQLRQHAERMMRLGETAEEAQERYVVPGRFQNFRIASWDFTIGAAMRSYFRALVGASGAGKRSADGATDRAPSA
jgi:glyoxylase-like metal-dependent hydrolase (beta-lactamase superfamily II)